MAGAFSTAFSSAFDIGAEVRSAKRRSLYRRKRTPKIIWLEGTKPAPLPELPPPPPLAAKDYKSLLTREGETQPTPKALPPQSPPAIADVPRMRIEPRVLATTRVSAGIKFGGVPLPTSYARPGIGGSRAPRAPMSTRGVRW